MKSGTPKRSRLIYMGMIVSSCLLTIIFFQILYRYDNKYSTRIDSGKLYTEENLGGSSPAALVDGWNVCAGIFSPAELEAAMQKPDFYSLETYIGEYKSFDSPSVTYWLDLPYEGEDRAISFDFTEIHYRYQIWLNGSPLLSGYGNACANGVLRRGNNRLVVNVTEGNYYYTGIYYPPLMGSVQNILSVNNARTAVYGMMLFSSLALALFHFIIWRDKEEPLYREYGLLCISFCAYISYYFIHLFHLPGGQFWYLAEEVSFCLLLFCLLLVTARVTQINRRPYFKKWVLPAFVIACAAGILCYLLIPIAGWAVRIHGCIQSALRAGVILWLIWTVWSVKSKRSFEYVYIIAGSSVFGLGILENLVRTNVYEPIRTAWQTEWSAYILVLVFGAMMSVRNKRILQENNMYKKELESLVEQRTAQLQALLDERKTFFSCIAHDLKAPFTAICGFTRMIRSHDVRLDHELEEYLSAVERREEDMSHRLSALSELNSLDKIKGGYGWIEVNGLLELVEKYLKPEAEVSAVYMEVGRLKREARIWGQQEKLMILFENLVYNALRVTPQGGRIRIIPSLEGKTVKIQVEDNGKGISPEDLPRIFEQYFVGRENQKEGSGIGLFIVKTVLTEMGGDIHVRSELGAGSCFTIEIPADPVTERAGNAEKTAWLDGSDSGEGEHKIKD